MRRGRLIAAALCLLALPALAQQARPGFAPGFRAGFQFLNPFAQPPFLLNFAANSIPTALTGSGASNGTVTNCSSKYIVAATAPRLDCSGAPSALLVEVASTNLATNSNAPASWTQLSGGATLTANSVPGPDGASTSGSAVALTSTGYFYGRWDSINTAGTYVCSLNLWASAGGNVALRGFNGSGAQASAAVITLAAGFNRFSVVFNFTSAPTSIYCGIDNETAFGGDGIAKTVDFAFMQIEELSAATSYVASGASAVTRSADADAFTIPSGIGHLIYTFGDGTTQTVAASPGSYTIPTTLNETRIEKITGTP